MTRAKRAMAWSAATMMAAVSVSVAWGQPCAGEWERFPATGLLGDVRSLVWFDEGTGRGPELYASGLIEVPAPGVGGAGGAEGVDQHVARWSGDRWIALNEGLPHVSEVFEMAVFDEDGDGPGGPRLFLGTDGAGLLRWKGDRWERAITPLCGPVRSLRVSDDGDGAALYLGGRISKCSSNPGMWVGKWRNGELQSMAEGLEMDVWGMHIEEGDEGTRIYVTGEDLTGANRVAAMWDGSQWVPFPSAFWGTGYAITRFDDGTGHGPRLFVGGRYFTWGTGEEQALVWNNGAWERAGEGLQAAFQPSVRMFDIQRIDGVQRLVAGGWFDSSGEVALRNLAVWGGASWTPHPLGTDDTVRCITTGPGDDAHTTYYGGSFYRANDQPAVKVAGFDGERIDTFGVNEGTSRPVLALSYAAIGGHEPALYAGGDFRRAGSVTVSRIAMLTDAGWSGLGEGVDGPVLKLGAFRLPGAEQADLFVAGRFLHAGEHAASSIARWDGEHWHDLNGGLFSIHGQGQWAQTLAMYDDGSGPALFVGGMFRWADNAANEVNNIAKWDGAHWTPLGSGMNGEVLHLEVFDDGNGAKLYAAGRFSVAGEVPADGIACWDGTAWASVGPDVAIGEVVSMVTSTVGGRTRLLVAARESAGLGGFLAWDGTHWEQLPMPDEDEPAAVPSSLTEVEDERGRGIVGVGEFTIEGVATRLARWNGDVWVPFPNDAGTQDAQGILERVREDGRDTLWMGGDFWLVDGRSSARLARYTGCPSCRVDWNGDGEENSTDFFDFLDDFFASDADFNRDGGTDSQDFFDFLDMFFTGC